MMAAETESTGILEQACGIVIPEQKRWGLYAQFMLYESEIEFSHLMAVSGIVTATLWKSE